MARRISPSGKAYNRVSVAPRSTFSNWTLTDPTKLVRKDGGEGVSDAGPRLNVLAPTISNGSPIPATAEDASALEHDEIPKTVEHAVQDYVTAMHKIKHTVDLPGSLKAAQEAALKIHAAATDEPIAQTLKSPELQKYSAALGLQDKDTVQAAAVSQAIPLTRVARQKDWGKLKVQAAVLAANVQYLSDLAQGSNGTSGTGSKFDVGI